VFVKEECVLIIFVDSSYAVVRGVLLLVVNTGLEPESCFFFVFVLAFGIRTYNIHRCTDVSVQRF
jgi:hypothetical protein